MNPELKKVTRIAAYGVVLQDQQILLCRLSALVKEATGMWTLPGGGVEFGEDPFDAVIREVREETGLVVQPGRIVGVHNRFVDRRDHLYHSIRIVYEARYIDGELADEIGGTTDLARWHPLERLGDLPIVDLVQFSLEKRAGTS